MLSLRRAARLVFLVVFFVALSAGCSKRAAEPPQPTADGAPARVSPADCDRLVERFVELLVAEAAGDASTEDVGAWKAGARKLAAEDPVFSRCESHISPEQLECAMNAPTALALERCFR